MLYSYCFINEQYAIDSRTSTYLSVFSMYWEVIDELSLIAVVKIYIVEALRFDP